MFFREENTKRISSFITERERERERERETKKTFPLPPIMRVRAEGS